MNLDKYISKVVCEHYKVSPHEVTAYTRKRIYLIPRQVINYFMNLHSNLPHREIAARMNRERSSVSWDTKAVKDRMDVYPEFRETIIHLNTLINARKSNKETMYEAVGELGVDGDPPDSNLAERHP